MSPLSGKDDIPRRGSDTGRVWWGGAWARGWECVRKADGYTTTDRLKKSRVEQVRESPTPAFGGLETNEEASKEDHKTTKKKQHYTPRNIAPCNHASVASVAR